MSYIPPSRVYGCTRLCVKEFAGAVGDGIHDDTAAFQKAIDMLPVAGGVVHVPAGTYLIDALVSVNLRSNMLLDMDPDAVLVAKPNSEPRSRILHLESLHDVEIRGGQLVGDREKHTYTKIYLKDGVTLSSLSTHEWGHAIGIGGCVGVTIDGTRMSDCTGDGISMGAIKDKYPWVVSKDIVINNVVSTNNRRQGLSITNVDGVKVMYSIFTKTNGTSPQCGIDLEPDNDEVTDKTGKVTRAGTIAGRCRNVWIEGCTFQGNAVYGLNVFLRVDNVTVTLCTFIENVSCGAVSVQPTGINFLKNKFVRNGSTGLFMKVGVVGGVVNDNEFELNYTKQKPVLRKVPLVVAGVVKGTARDILVSTGSGTKVGTNTYK